MPSKFDLKLKDSERRKNRLFPEITIFSSSKLNLQAGLPNVEETLQILGAALLKSAEVGRLQGVATLAKTYKEAFSEYLDYRGIEEHLDSGNDVFRSIALAVYATAQMEPEPFLTIIQKIISLSLNLPECRFTFTYLPTVSNSRLKSQFKTSNVLVAILQLW